MKRIIVGLMVVMSSLSFVAVNVEAKRLGGGTSSGMKRQTPPPDQAQTPAKPAATPGPTNAAAPAAAAAPKRSWLGPIAGIAAGLGLAALMSHLGFGGEMANILTMVLMAAAAFFVIRFLLRRFGPGAAQRQAAVAGPQGLQFAGAGAGTGPGAAAGGSTGGGFSSMGSGSSFAAPAAAAAAATVSALPAGFDAAGFERIAKLIFIRMQAANDAGNLDDLRQFATPEMFATFRLELQDRRGAAQQTDVMQLDAQVLDVAEEAGQQIVSVRFHGLVSEFKDAPAAPFDETWHLVKPNDGSREWAIAGIAQNTVN
ncbi:Tim44 domain-containing protein [Aquabacterium sp.]|uniref:Tim44 domain-containing protein n=1 Tax=Aquabacterium sp. TaxID=1872578 RepID=UPI002CE5F5F4|nr:TIM44-like domain-containing protein [Aquabacterium sp.]HSW05213.1 TIM44-like domain-containing protein [Aquabacterium sp.]